MICNIKFSLCNTNVFLTLYKTFFIKTSIKKHKFDKLWVLAARCVYIVIRRLANMAFFFRKPHKAMPNSLN